MTISNLKEIVDWNLRHGVDASTEVVLSSDNFLFPISAGTRQIQKGMVFAFTTKEKLVPECGSRNHAVETETKTVRRGTRNVTAVLCVCGHEVKKTYQYCPSCGQKLVQKDS